MKTGIGQPTVTSPVPRAVWESLLRSDQNALVSQSLPWRDALFASGRYQDASLLYEFPSGRQVVLPFARHGLQPSWGARLTSWPRGWEVGGPITPGGPVSPDEAAAVFADVLGQGTLMTAIKLRHDADRVWLSEARQFGVDKFSYWVLDLAGGFGQVWQHKFRGTARTAIRKAERSGLDVEVDRSGKLLHVVHELHEKSIARWAAMQQAPLWATRRRMNRDCPASPDRLALVAGHFGEQCTTWVARSKGQPVAAIIVLRSGAYAKYWRGAMDKELATPVRANELLHRLAIEEACRDGYRFYDMGGAEPGSSLAGFKEKLGTTVHSSYLLRAERLPVRAAVRRSENLVKMISFRAIRRN